MIARPSRRRFLAIAAAAALAPRAAAAAETVWRGAALGAEAAITLRGGEAAAAEAALAAARAEIATVEALFSLHRGDSALSRLNRDGALEAAPPDFAALLALCDAMHAATGGAFDPTVQPLWAAYAAAAPAAPDPAALAAARAAVGWPRVARDGARIRLAPGMALTLNGIAQGWAADRVAAALAAHGFAATLVDMGEIAAGAGTWRVGLVDPAHGLLGTRTLSRMAIATSSPGALRFGAGGPAHILHPADPARPALWSTVAVEARSAAVADALSTAGCFLDRAALAALKALRPDLGRITLIDAAGRIATL